MLNDNELGTYPVYYHTRLKWGTSTWECEHSPSDLARGCVFVRDFLARLQVALDDGVERNKYKQFNFNCIFHL